MNKFQRAAIAVGAVLWLCSFAAASGFPEELPRFIQAQIAGNGAPQSVAVTGDGGYVMVGTFGGTATFGTTNVVAGSGIDIFVAKYTPDGHLAWLSTAGGNDPPPNPPWTKAHEAHDVQQFSLWKMGMGWQRCERACGRSVTGA